MSDLTDDELRARLKYAMGERHLEPFVEPLRELQRHRAARAPDAQRVREVVHYCCSEADAAYASGHVATVRERHQRIADRVAAQLGPIGMSAEDRDVLQRMRTRTANLRDDWNGWPTEKTYAQELALLDRLLGVTP